MYGVHAPTAFANGPSLVECQADWIVDVIKKLTDENVNYLDATTEAEEAWRDGIRQLSDRTLFPGTKSWYNGDNIPGKPREPLNYLGGLPLYAKECRDALNSGFKGFVTA